MLYSITSCQKLSDIFKKHQQHLPGPQLHIIPLSFNLSFAIKKNWPKKQTYIQMKPSFAARCNMLQFPLWTTLKLYKSALYMSTALSRWAVYVPHADVHWYGSWSVKQIKGLLYFADHCVIGSLSCYSFTLSQACRGFILASVWYKLLIRIHLTLCGSFTFYCLFVFIEFSAQYVRHVGCFDCEAVDMRVLSFSFTIICAKKKTLTSDFSLPHTV